MDRLKLENFLKKHNQPAFRKKQIEKAIFSEGISEFSEITTISKNLREGLEKEMSLFSFRVLKIAGAKNKQSAKALLKLSDGSLIESVLISPKPNMWSVCVSSQVGCQMGCRFCATGAMGFKRNLSAEEITDQVLFWRQYLKKRFQDFDVTNIVYMGMGEPFNNWKNVAESIRNLTDKDMFGLRWRSISVSTSGIAEGIKNLAKEFPQVNLALSLHFAEDEKRSAMMPVNKRDDLKKIKAALQEYFSLTNRKVFIEYILLEGLNDKKTDADNLANYLSSIGKIHLLHVNLIRYNVTSGYFKASPRERAQRFKKFLQEKGISATIRKSLGEEIEGACGQLAAK